MAGCGQCSKNAFVSMAGYSSLWLAAVSALKMLFFSMAGCSSLWLAVVSALCYLQCSNTTACGKKNISSSSKKLVPYGTGGRLLLTVNFQVT